MPRVANPDETTPDYPITHLLRDVWGFTRSHRVSLFLISSLSISREIAGLYPVYAFAQIVTLLSNDAAGHTSDITRVFIMVVLAVTWAMVSTYVSRIYGSYILERIGADIELHALKHLFKIDIAWHEKENTGNKLRRINSGSGGIQQIIRLWLNSIIQILVAVGGSIAIIAKFNAFIAITVIVFIAVHYTISYLVTKKAARAAYATSIQAEIVHGLEVQAVSNIRTVKVMSLARPLYGRIASEVADFYNKIRRRIFLFQTRGTLLGLWGQSVRYAVLGYIIFGVVHGKYDLGFLVLFNGYFSMIRDLASQISGLGQDLTMARFSISRLKDVLAEPIAIDDDTGKQMFPAHWENISFRGVSFGYGDAMVLKDTTFTIRRGEKIGIVGLSGAGKSTLFKLLLKEYENFTGSICIDDTPIQEVQKTDYFNHVAVVLQDTEVFNFSLKENVILANDSEKDNQALLDQSLAIAHVTDFLHKLPEGVNSLIGEKGVKLSGGEKQRLGIARAVFKQPEILLLDEATSHLDIESEAKIKDSLHTFFQNVTAIVIAHRLTTIREMDKILVIEEGRLIEQGSFSELHAKQGRFYELWEKQKL